MEMTTVAVAMDLIGRASKALDSLRERAKTSKDAELKENISNLYDHFLDLKETVLRIKEENAELRRTIAAQAEQPPKPEIRQFGETHYYFVGEDGPFCQPCYDSHRKLVRLMPLQDYAGGPGRKCEVCSKVFFQSRRPMGPLSVTGDSLDIFRR
jgi:hypothetical protein